MGNVSSRVEDGLPLMVRDQNRLTVTSLKITSARNRVLYTIVPNTFPATRYAVKREKDDEAPIEYIQDPEAATGAFPNFLLKLNNDEDLVFYFTFAMRQGQQLPNATDSTDSAFTDPASSSTDTSINGLTFLFASTTKELETLTTREFNADPNLHKNPNVDLVGNYTTNGRPVEQFEWSWKWRPPKSEKDGGGGWRTSCSFVEYDQRAHRLNTLLSFAFWVQNNRVFGSPRPSSARLEVSGSQRHRIPSAQSVDSRLSDSDTEFPPKDSREPPSPGVEAIPEDTGLELEPTMTANAVKVDVNCQRPGDDISAAEDGPVFRATMKAMEQKTSNMRSRMKNVLKKAEAARDSQIACNRSIQAFTEALREASISNANAVKPALDHYFEKIAKEILSYERSNAENLQKLIIEPISKLYSNDIKQVEAKRKDFEEESRDFYAYVGRYLGQRQDSLKEKKRAESDSKYEAKRKNFELKRFDYSSFMQDLHGGRKDQEVLSQLTKYADTQSQGYLSTAKKVEALMPQLEALIFEVREADKEFQLQRTGREEKRRTLEKSSKTNSDTENSAWGSSSTLANPNGVSSSAIYESTSNTSTGLTHSQSLSDRRSSAGGPSLLTGTDPSFSTSPRSAANVISSSPGQNRFKGIRDLEERIPVTGSDAASKDVSHRREGLLWSLSRPGSHVDPKGLNKQAWHKYWIVLDQGKLCEYDNWKNNPEQHRDPIDLRMASVREARNAERRFCFEVITPTFTRVYQAPTEQDMKGWIQAINNALQSAFEEKGPLTSSKPSTGKSASSIAKELFGKSSSYHGHRSTSSSSTYMNTKNVARHATVGDRPPLSSRNSEERPAQLLQSIRDADAGNVWCADCGSDNRVEWVSINLGIIVCIECGGIHRSLGTHISKMRFLTLDTFSFTQDVTELLLRIGNRVSNMIWEAMLDRSSGVKPSPSSTRDHRLKYITSKYVDRAFVNPQTTTTRSMDETLLASIKRNDLQQVLQALALKASPNAHDRSRSTHAVFLALAAADPASPASTTHSPAQPTTPSGTSTPLLRMSFPVAELLLQNGADLPSTPPPIPLGHSAQLYLDFKKDQKLGRVNNHSNSSNGGHDMPSASQFDGSNDHPTNGFSSPISTTTTTAPLTSVPVESNGDTLTALPRFDQDTSTTPSGMKDRPLKRSSGVGKLVRGYSSSKDRDRETGFREPGTGVGGSSHSSSTSAGSSSGYGMKP